MKKRTLRTMTRLIETYGLHNAALFKALRLDRLTSREKSEGRRNDATFYALGKSGFDFSKVEFSVIDWGAELGYADIDDDRLIIRNERGEPYRDNRGVCSLVTALLHVFDDIKPFAHYSVRSGDCRIAQDYALDLAPLVNHSTGGTALAEKILPGEIAAAPYTALSREYARLTGAIFVDTSDGGKPLLAPHALAAIKHWTDFSLADIRDAEARPFISDRNVTGFIQATKRVLQLLYKRYPTVTNRSRREKMRSVLDDCLLLYLRLCAASLLCAGYGDGPFRLGVGEASRLMSDEVAGTLASRFREVFRDFQDLEVIRGLESYSLISKIFEPREEFFTRFRFYRKNFIALGDEYGDCTATMPSSQVDARVANIHWTVYPWLLNPYYRVLEVCRADGRGLIKAHIAPLVIEGRRVLMVDAIESIPALRREAFGRSEAEAARHERDGRVFNEKFFDANARGAFDALMKRCVELGRAVGVDAVYADMYSNAVWIRELLENDYPHDSYHTSNVEVPFGSYEVEDTTDLIAKNAGVGCESARIKMEIQAMNVGLMHQSARSNYKIVAVPFGIRDDWSVRVRAL